MTGEAGGRTDRWREEKVTDSFLFYFHPSSIFILTWEPFPTYPDCLSFCLSVPTLLPVFLSLPCVDVAVKPLGLEWRYSLEGR